MNNNNGWDNQKWAETSNFYCVPSKAYLLYWLSERLGGLAEADFVISLFKVVYP